MTATWVYTGRFQGRLDIVIEELTELAKAPEPRAT
jgi:hypothetical protein